VVLVGRNEEIIHRNGRGDQRLIGEIGDEGFERRPVGFKPVRPWVAIEQLVNFIDVAHEERRHVAQRAQIEHFLERDLLGFAKRVVQARGNEGISLVELFTDGNEMHDRVDLRALVERLFELHVIGEQAHDVRVAADGLGQARAQRRVDCALLDQVAHRFVRGVLLDRHGLEQRQHRRSAVRAAGVHRPLNPMDLPEIDAVFVLQQPIDVDGRGHGEQRDAHALALEVLGGLDAGLAVDGNEAVAKRTRGKDRNADERALLAGEALHELRARKLGDVEFLAARHPVEDRSRLIDGDEIEVDALDLDLAGIERLHAVVEPARERKLQLGHLLAVPGALEQGVSLSTRARRAKTPVGSLPLAAYDRQHGNDDRAKDMTTREASCSAQPGVVERLAAWVLAMQARDLSQAAVLQAKPLLLDTIGCGFAALDEQSARGLLAVVEASGGAPQCTIIGRARRTSAANAVLANGALVRILDFNDYVNAKGGALGGHPSDNIPVALAAGELAGSSGREVVAAVVLGYEIFGRCKELMERDSAWDGVTVSGLVAPAMAGRLMGLDHGRLAHAIALSAARAATSTAVRFGDISAAKSIANALVAQNGMQAALLAEPGINGAPRL